MKPKKYNPPIYDHRCKKCHRSCSYRQERPIAWLNKITMLCNECSKNE